MKIKTLLFIFVFLILFSLFGCDNTNEVLNELQFPETNVSYSRHVQTLFNVKCNYSHCHGAGSGNSLILTSYFDATRSPGMIAKGDPDKSTLNRRLEGRIQPSMPIIGGVLPSNFINGVRTWVKEGAKNN